MKTIFILAQESSYSTGIKPLLAYESKVDAEAMEAILKDALRGEIKILEVPLQAAQPHKPLPVQPRDPQVLIPRFTVATTEAAS